MCCGAEFDFAATPPPPPPVRNAKSSPPESGFRINDSRQSVSVEVDVGRMLSEEVVFVRLPQLELFLLWIAEAVERRIVAAHRGSVFL